MWLVVNIGACVASDLYMYIVQVHVWLVVRGEYLVKGGESLRLLQLLNQSNTERSIARVEVVQVIRVLHRESICTC